MTLHPLTAHGSFFMDHPPTPHLERLLDAGPLLAMAGGLTVALTMWMVASTFADPRRCSGLVRWMSDSVSELLGSATELVPVIARVLLGGAFVWCAVIDAIGTPNLHVHGAAGLAARLVAAMLGTSLVLGMRPRLTAAGCTVLMGASAVAIHHPVAFVERLDIVGLAAFVMCVGGRRFEPRMDAATLTAIARGTRWMRWLVASGLLTVAITEKLANVPMTAKILAEHPHVDLGLLLGTSPATTVLILGAAEVAFAALVLLLPLPELLALAIGAPFVLTVGEFGLLEVPGHMPVWGAAASLALLGAHPQTADLLSVRPPWMRGSQRTPDAARDRTVGPRVPWVTVPAATTGRILVGSVAPRPVPAPVGVAPVRTAASAVPTALPQLQSQVAAWLVAPPQLPGVSTAAAHHATRGPAPDPGAVSAHEPPRFTWRAEPARLAGSTPPAR